MVGKVEHLEALRLAEQRDEGAAGPVEALAEQLLDRVLGVADRDAKDKLQCRPNSIELDALVNVHDVVLRLLVTHPQALVLFEVTADTVQDRLED